MSLEGKVTTHLRSHTIQKENGDKLLRTQYNTTELLKRDNDHLQGEKKREKASKQADEIQMQQR